MNFPELSFAHQSASLVGTFLTIPFALSPIRTHVRTGNIQVLEKLPMLTSVNFYECENIQGEHTWNEIF